MNSVVMGRHWAPFTIRGRGGPPSLAVASLTRPAAQVRVTRRGPPSIAAALVTRCGLQSITLHGPSHLSQKESLV